MAVSLSVGGCTVSCCIVGVVGLDTVSGADCEVVGEGVSVLDVEAALDCVAEVLDVVGFAGE